MTMGRKEETKARGTLTLLPDMEFDCGRGRKLYQMWGEAVIAPALMRWERSGRFGLCFQGLLEVLEL